MDFHLDWVFAAHRYRYVALDSVSYESQESEDFRLPGGPDDKPIYVNDNIEDVDLLVAFLQGGVPTLVFVEAKGDSAWDSDQIWKKVWRLKKTFGLAPQDVDLRVVLMSPPKADPNEIVKKKAGVQEARVPVPDWAPDWALRAEAPDKVWRFLPFVGLDGKKLLRREKEGSEWFYVKPSQFSSASAREEHDSSEDPWW